MIEIAKSLFTKLKAATGGILDLKDASGGFFLRTQGKTADYTCVRSDSGSIFTTRGATGAVVFTLPPVYQGWWAIFFCGANQDLTVATATADTLITFNDVAADSLAIDTTEAGHAIFVFCDGTQYHATAMLSADTTILTVAT